MEGTRKYTLVCWRVTANQIILIITFQNFSELKKHRSKYITYTNNTFVTKKQIIKKKKNDHIHRIQKVMGPWLLDFMFYFY